MRGEAQDENALACRRRGKREITPGNWKGERVKCVRGASVVEVSEFTKKKKKTKTKKKRRR
jgi:hypothetical protein